MAIKGHEDLWVEIQAHTFRNWVNENLRGAGMAVADLAQDFQDGTKLCALIEALQKRPLRGWVRRPVNRHQHLENVSCALKAVEADGVKLVNIGESGYHLRHRAPRTPGTATPCDVVVTRPSGRRPCKQHIPPERPTLVHYVLVLRTRGTDRLK